MTDLHSLLGSTVTCDETGKSFVVESDGFTYNCATRNDGAIVSDKGVNLCEVRNLKDKPERFYAYVSSDGKSVTGWKGNALGRIIWARTVKLTRQSFTHGSTMNSYRVQDVHGQFWHGRGSPGISIALRPVKA